MYQFRGGTSSKPNLMFDPSIEFDADLWGFIFSSLVGYDPYAVLAQGLRRPLGMPNPGVGK
jgi:hypothetical protein